ncbi:MAG: sugar transferase [Verrucomicrobiae bacterium]|nr:sugar transferase [Verrucomicrobiae bacterium]
MFPGRIPDRARAGSTPSGPATSCSPFWASDPDVARDGAGRPGHLARRTADRSFFSQTRIGRNGTPFRIVKLRTMRVARPECPGDRYTRPGDRRITRIGRFLRASRLDEFPQLWNVLRGDMSLNGPLKWTSS